MSDTSQIRVLAPAELDRASGGTQLFAMMHFYETQARINNERLRALTAAESHQYGKLIRDLFG
jgi:hypothetical protein